MSTFSQDRTSVSVRGILRIAFLIGHDDESTRDVIEAVCKLPNTDTIAVLMDTEPCSLSRRFKNLRRNLRIDGWTYIARRVLAFARNFTERLAFRAVVSQHEVQNLLRRAFPQRCFDIAEVSRHYGFSVYSAGNLNGRLAVEILKAVRADLGIVLGTRILKRSTFNIPRLGCINLHKGAVPAYRGMPPGFWELFDGASTAGVTVHFVDSGLDTGDILATGNIPISTKDTPSTVIEKLHKAGVIVLCEAVARLQDGSATPRPQRNIANKARSRPSHKEVVTLKERLSHWNISNDGYRVLKNLYSLVLYYSGAYALVRAMHRRSRSRGAIFLYHRINNYARDPLTVDTHAFASHLAALSSRYPTMTTSDLVRRMREGVCVPPTTVTIHFDDCYQDVYTNGAPLLVAAGFPATAFLNSGFIDTTRVYPHDADKYPFSFPNLTNEEVRNWVHLGFEIGNHTVNHVDLGVHPLEESHREIEECGNTLANITGRTINLFSFPFGNTRNVRQEVVEYIRESGYKAVFSAHGGFVTSRTDPYDIPRLGASGDLNPLVLLLEVEGVAPHQIVSRYRDLIGRITGMR
jgi:peptidoglycan/xylan/chitin deacetylase (PgdA/CDA1 family)/folate-dependent phosphoribosylglycinamide formyltransferase PurN